MARATLKQRLQAGEPAVGCSLNLFSAMAAEIMAQAQASHLPLRPTVSWLVFEAGRIKDIPNERVEELKAFWQENHAADEGELIPPPPSQLGF